METRNNPFGFIRYGGGGPFEAPRKAANDLKSLDDRFRELLDAYCFWKYLPRYRIKAMTFGQRIILRDMQSRVRRFEQETGVVL
jgi:hypothetical protein